MVLLFHALAKMMHQIFLSLVSVSISLRVVFMPTIFCHAHPLFGFTCRPLLRPSFGTVSVPKLQNHLEVILIAHCLQPLFPYDLVVFPYATVYFIVADFLVTWACGRQMIVMG
jgi:hypothetical protein